MNGDGWPRWFKSGVKIIFFYTLLTLLTILSRKINPLYDDLLFFIVFIFILHMLALIFVRTPPILTPLLALITSTLLAILFLSAISKRERPEGIIAGFALVLIGIPLLISNLFFTLVGSYMIKKELDFHKKNIEKKLILISISIIIVIIALIILTASIW